MDDKYPIPSSGETWEILEQEQYFEDGCSKYSVLVNSTQNGETVLKKYTRVYKTVYNDEATRYKNWKKFGAVKHHPMGFIDKESTNVVEHPIFLELTHPELIKKYAKYHSQYSFNLLNPSSLSTSTTKETPKKSHIICRYCKGLHFSYKCSDKDNFTHLAENTIEPQPSNVDLNKAQMPLSETNNKSSYVPPHKRNRQQNDTSNLDKPENNRPGNNRPGNDRNRNDRNRNGNDRNSNDRNRFGNDRNRNGNDRNGNDKSNVKGIKIDNIAIYSDEEDVKNICLQYGRIYKFKLIKREERGFSFAFVTYTSEASSEEAVKQLNGSRLDGCVWSTQWASF